MPNALTLFETLAIKNGRILNLGQHNRRFLRGQRFLGVDIAKDLARWVDLAKAAECGDWVRCRVDYSAQGVCVAYSAYRPRRVRSFRLVFCDAVEYRYKFADRRSLDRLLAQKGDCDEVIIIKNGFVSDCSIGNLIFGKNNQWFTPDTPLLCGTQRQFLLEAGKVQAVRMGVLDIARYDKIALINALNPFDPDTAVDISAVRD